MLDHTLIVWTNENGEQHHAGYQRWPVSRRSYWHPARSIYSLPRQRLRGGTHTRRLPGLSATSQARHAMILAAGREASPAPEPLSTSSSRHQRADKEMTWVRSDTLPAYTFVALCSICGVHLQAAICVRESASRVHIGASLLHHCVALGHLCP